MIIMITMIIRPMTHSVSQTPNHRLQPKTVWLQTVYEKFHWNYNVQD